MFHKGGFLPSQGTIRSGRSRRRAVVAECRRECRRWADTGRTWIALGRTGARAIADIQLRARSTLHRPKQMSTDAPIERYDGRTPVIRCAYGNGEFGAMR